MRNWGAKSIIFEKQSLAANSSPVPCALRHLRGFSLIEIMVVVAIVTVIMGIAFTSLRLSDSLRDLVFIRIQLYRQNKRAHDVIAEELEKSQSSRVDITDSNPDAIYLQIPLINSIDNTTYSIPWGARYNNTDYVFSDIIYRLNGTNLVREVSNQPGSKEIIAADIINLQFSRVDGNANYIRINTTAQKMTIAPRRPINASLESTVYLLN